MREILAPERISYVYLSYQKGSKEHSLSPTPLPAPTGNLTESSTPNPTTMSQYVTLVERFVATLGNAKFKAEEMSKSVGKFIICMDEHYTTDEAWDVLLRYEQAGKFPEYTKALRTWLGKMPDQMAWQKEAEYDNY